MGRVRVGVGVRVGVRARPVVRVRVGVRIRVRVRVRFVVAAHGTRCARGWNAYSERPALTLTMTCHVNPNPP